MNLTCLEHTNAYNAKSIIDRQTPHTLQESPFSLLSSNIALVWVQMIFILRICCLYVKISVTMATVPWQQIWLPWQPTSNMAII